ARLGRMAAYRDRAVELAAALRTVPGVRVVPDPPVAGMLHVHLPAPAPAVTAALLEVAAETRVCIAARAVPLADDRPAVEFSVGEATFAVPPAEAAALFARLLRRR